MRGTILEVPLRRFIVHRGLHWGPLILGNYKATQVVKDWVRTASVWQEGLGLRVQELDFRIKGLRIRI